VLAEVQENRLDEFHRPILQRVLLEELELHYTVDAADQVD
jgi:hypothetical protein